MAATNLYRDRQRFYFRRAVSVLFFPLPLPLLVRQTVYDL